MHYVTFTRAIGLTPLYVRVNAVDMVEKTEVSTTLLTVAGQRVAVTESLDEVLARLEAITS